MQDRIKRRNSGQGKYTAKGVPWKLIHTFDCQDRT
ncbi:MAG: GIY-YIG nuclease family protein, partial [Flavisolibacter sp.]|nr:GIY-YIG nuclease family protein [Flavisolibacter sp.]